MPRRPSPDDARTEGGRWVAADPPASVWRTTGNAIANEPWVPVFNEQRYTMKSERMGGDDALYVDPVSIPVNYDYVFVTE